MFSNVFFKDIVLFFLCYSIIRYILIEGLNRSHVIVMVCIRRILCLLLGLVVMWRATIYATFGFSLCMWIFYTRTYYIILYIYLIIITHVVIIENICTSSDPNPKKIISPSLPQHCSPSPLKHTILQKELQLSNLINRHRYSLSHKPVTINKTMSNIKMFTKLYKLILSFEEL